MCKKSLLLLFLLPFQFVFAQTSLLTDFPEGYTPKEVGKRLAYHFVDGKHMLHIGKWISYPETFTWNGGLKFAALTNDQELVKLLQNRFELLFTTEKALLPIMNHVDVNMFGSLPLELYKITKDQRYLDLGLPYADTQWQLPRAAKEMVMYLDELQCPNGLFYHAPDVPFYWGRGNGWMAAGMAELLSSLPEDSEYRPRILHGYRTMMKSLKKYQSSNGLWHQLLDHPDCWLETSGSAMFTFAFIKGVKNGWLDAKEYAPAARKAWMAMVKYIDENDNVKSVCEGTNKKNDKQYYYDRKQNVGDYHGQAPYLWCAVALLEE